jgi:vacuolar-type H+-ATPase subunit I/STV1
MADQKSIEELVDTVRSDERRKAEIVSLLSEIQKCFSNLEDALQSLDKQHNARNKQLNWIEKICTGIYNQLQILTTILAQDMKNELEQSDELRKELEKRGLKRDAMEILANRDVQIGISGDLVGGNKGNNENT